MSSEITADTKSMSASIMGEISATSSDIRQQIYGVSSELTTDIDEVSTYISGVVQAEINERLSVNTEHNRNISYLSSTLCSEIAVRGEETSYVSSVIDDNDAASKTRDNLLSNALTLHDIKNTKQFIEADK